MNFLETRLLGPFRAAFSSSKQSSKSTNKAQLRYVNLILFVIVSFVSFINACEMSPFGRFNAKGNLELIQYLKRCGIVKSEKVYNVMSQVDRAKYTHPTRAYVDSPQDIGFGATISAPHMHGYALEFLAEKLEEGGRALDVGSGSGYLTVCMALMVGPSGVAVGIEHIPQLEEIAKKNIENDHPELLENKQVELVVGDGRKGYPSKAPYNAIHVGAASEEVPQVLISQLAPGGRMIIPIGKRNFDQTLFQIDKTMDGEVQQTSLMGVVYVPLTDKDRQYRS